MRRPDPPSYPCTSLPQMPHASTRMSTSSGPGRGIGTSTISSLPYSESNKAFIMTGWYRIVSAAAAPKLVAEHLRERLGAAGAQVLNRDFHFSPPVRVFGRAAGQVLLFGFLREVF